MFKRFNEAPQQDEWIGFVAWGEDFTFDCGKAYILHSDSDFSFQWRECIPREPFVRGEPVFFAYEKQANYEVVIIDTIETAFPVLEVGAFMEGVCVGGVKIDQYPAQILAYTEGFGNAEMTFQIFTENYFGKIVASQTESVLDETLSQSPLRKMRLIEKKQTARQIPTDYQMRPNFPNPFNPETMIETSLPHSNDVQLFIYDVRGKLIQKLVERPMSAGHHSIIWNGRNRQNRPVASGLYFCKLTVGSKKIPIFSKIQKMVAVR